MKIYGLTTKENFYRNFDEDRMKLNTINTLGNDFCFGEDLFNLYRNSKDFIKDQPIETKNCVFAFDLNVNQICQLLCRCNVENVYVQLYFETSEIISVDE